MRNLFILEDLNSTNGLTETLSFLSDFAKDVDEAESRAAEEPAAPAQGQHGVQDRAFAELPGEEDHDAEQRERGGREAEEGRGEGLRDLL